VWQSESLNSIGPAYIRSLYPSAFGDLFCSTGTFGGNHATNRGMAHEGLPGIVQEALSRIEILLDTLFQSAKDAIFLMDGLYFVDCNPATLRMFGCQTKKDIIGKTPLSISPNLQPGGVSSAMEAERLVAAAMSGEPQHFEWRLCKFDGTEFDVEVSLNRCFVSGATFLVAVVRDITARKRAQAALRREIQEDELINKILSKFAGFIPSQFEATVENALRELAEFIGADHAFLFMVSPQRDTYSCTHETCGPGVASMRQNFQNVPLGTHAWIEPTLMAGETQQIESLLLLSTSGATEKSAGAIGIDSHGRQIKWSDSDVMLCTLVGNVLTAMMERKQAMDRLIQEKQFSERLIESLPGAFYLYDSDLRLRRWNKNHETGMGYTADELFGKRIGDMQATEEHRRSVLEAAHRALQQGGDVEVLETEVLYKDGSAIPYLVTGTRIDSPDGPMLAGVGLNISARVQAQKALAASEHKYREVFNGTNDAFFIHNASGRILEVNERACARFGFDVQQALRLSIGDVSSGEPPYSQRDALAKIRHAISNGPQVFDWQSKTVNGELFWSEVALRTFWIDGEVRVIASVRDITGRKLAALQRERMAAQSKYLEESASLLASSLDYTATLQRVVHLAVRAIADWCVVLLVEHGRVYIAEIVHSDPEKQAIIERFRSKYRARPDLPISVEGVIRTREPQLIPEITDESLREHSSDDEHYSLLRQLNPKSAMLVPLIFGDEILGSMAFVASNARHYEADDVAFAKRIARHAAIAIRNARLYTDAQGAIRARDAMLRMVSHDLRNPVSNIQMAATQLATSSLPDQGRQKILQTISRSSQRMNRLIEDLMTVGRIQEGREIPLNIDRVDPTVITDEVCAAVGPQLNAKSLDLRCDKPATIGAIKADRDRIIQVLVNLLDNAIKFTPSGGNIILSCEVRGGEVQFAVKDTGPGIDPKDLQQIFDPFWQAIPGARSGSGLGLSIAKVIVEQHNGRIWADSIPGFGTTVCFTIPQADIGKGPRKPKAA
jgi:PAS domain S-box-containing protein